MEEVKRAIMSSHPEWEITCIESTVLANLGGVLVLYGDECRVVVDATASSVGKEQGVQYVLGLIQQSAGADGIYVWYRET